MIATHHPLFLHTEIAAATVTQRALISGRTSNANGPTKSSARHRSAQAIIIGRKAPKILKWLSRNLRDFRPRKRTQFMRGPKCLLADGRSYANLIDRAAAPKNTKAAPTHSQRGKESWASR
jgi:hypothetical protein